MDSILGVAIVRRKDGVVSVVDSVVWEVVTVARQVHLQARRGSAFVIIDYEDSLLEVCAKRVSHALV